MKVKLDSFSVDKLVDRAIQQATNQYWCSMEDSYTYEGMKPATRCRIDIYVGDEVYYRYVPIERFSEFIESPLDFLIGPFWKRFHGEDDITTELDDTKNVNFFKVVENKANST